MDQGSPEKGGLESIISRDRIRLHLSVPDEIFLFRSLTSSCSTNVVAGQQRLARVRELNFPLLDPLVHIYTLDSQIFDLQLRSFGVVCSGINLLNFCFFYRI